MCHKVLLISKNVIFLCISSRFPSSNLCSSILANASVTGRPYFSIHFKITDIKDIRCTSWVFNIIMWYNQISTSDSRPCPQFIFCMGQSNFSVEVAPGNKTNSYIVLWPVTVIYPYLCILCPILGHGQVPGTSISS